MNVLPSSPELPLATPPLVSVDQEPSLTATHPVHYREVGRELPWLARAAGDQFKTYEGMVDAEPGRYLWIRLVLTGNAVFSPRIRGVRIEYPGTDWPNRLPEVYSEDPAGADFLFRFLSLPDGMMADLDARSAQRDLLLNAFSAPIEALAWIASLFGLSLDDRWSEASRRELLSEVCCLWRRRGTLGALTRLLEIYLGVAPVIVEAWRMRAVGGGGIGEGLTTDDFGPFAHRFSVIIPLLLDDTQIACVTDLLDRYKPAHTLYEVCTVGAGMRAGLGLHVGITSIVGPSAGWKQFELDHSRLGTDAVIGQAEQGFRPGGSRVGVDARADT
jgi:phage tail-like protein